MIEITEVENHIMVVVLPEVLLLEQKVQIINLLLGVNDLHPLKIVSIQKFLKVPLVLLVAEDLDLHLVIRLLVHVQEAVDLESKSSLNWNRINV